LIAPEAAEATRAIRKDNSYLKLPLQLLAVLPVQPQVGPKAAVLVEGLRQVLMLMQLAP